MRQVIYRFDFGSLSIPIYGYGLMLVLGFLAAVYLARYLARRSGLDGELFVNAGVLGLIAGIVGARLSHVLENLADFTRPELGLLGNLRNVIDLPSGGLTYYGGFLLAFPVVLLYVLRKKIPIRLGMDIVTPCLMIGLTAGRMGCFLNGCCYGTHTEAPWAVTFPYNSYAYNEHVATGQIELPAELMQRDEEGRILMAKGPDGEHRPIPEEPARLPRHVVQQHRSLPLHPTQLYSSATALLLAALLLAYFTLPHVPGRVFALMLILEGGTRFILEWLRTEPAVALGLTLSMHIGIGLVLLGLALWIVFGRLNSARPAALPVR